MKTAYKFRFLYGIYTAVFSFEKFAELAGAQQFPSGPHCKKMYPCKNYRQKSKSGQRETGTKKALYYTEYKAFLMVPVR